MLKIRLQLLFLILIALLIGAASIKLSQRQVQTVQEIDKDEFNQIATKLTQTSDKLSNIYKQKLDSLADSTLTLSKEELLQKITSITTVESVYLIDTEKQNAKPTLFSPLSPIKTPPTIFIEGTSPKPLTPPAFTFKINWLLPNNPNEKKVIINLSGTQILYFKHVNPTQIVAIITNFPEAKTIAQNYILKNLSDSLKPIQERNTPFQITLENTPVVVSLNTENISKTAIIIPIETDFGTWRIQAWNTTSFSTSTHTPTLLTGLSLAALLIILAFISYRSQKKNLLEATQKVTFLNRVSHELGTPLTNIQLNLELASRYIRSNPEMAGTKLTRVRDEVGRLTRLVNNVLTTSRKNQDTLQVSLHLCHPDEIIQDLISQFNASLQRNGIEIHTDLNTPTSISTDPDMLTQIIGNLISNAEKHATSGKYLKISSHYNTDQNLIIQVTDRGPGITPEESKIIFTPFKRLSASVSEGVSGTGLGLSICKDLAKLLNGTITLKSSTAGSIFTLTIPNNS